MSTVHVQYCTVPLSLAKDPLTMLRGPRYRYTVQYILYQSTVVVQYLPPLTLQCIGMFLHAAGCARARRADGKERASRDIAPGGLRAYERLTQRNARPSESKERASEVAPWRGRAFERTSVLSWYALCVAVSVSARSIQQSQQAQRTELEHRLVSHLR